MAMKFDKKTIRNTQTCKNRANFNQNKPKNKQPASLQKKNRKSTKKAQIRGESARLATLFNSHMQQNAYCRSFQPLLPCDCHALKANFKTILAQVSQPASAGNVADLVNCKLISHHCMMPEQWIRLLCSVSVILANETVVARIMSIKLLTLDVLEIFHS